MVGTRSVGVSTRLGPGTSSALWSTASDVRQRAQQATARSLSTLERSRQTQARAQLARQQAQQARGGPASGGQGTVVLRPGPKRKPVRGQPTMATCLQGFTLDSPPLEVCARVLGLDGLALLLAPGDGLPELMHCSGSLSRQLEDVQMVHGQGPTYDAAQTTTHVGVPDLAASGPERWPGLPPALSALGVRAVFAYPLQLGSRAFGVLSGHRRAPGNMTPTQHGDALALTDTIMLALARDPYWLTARRHLPFAPVHQATGTLAARLGISPEQALLRLRAHALSHDRSALSTARAVLHHRLLLDEETEDEETDARS